MTEVQLTLPDGNTRTIRSDIPGQAIDEAHRLALSHTVAGQPVQVVVREDGRERKSSLFGLARWGV